jgi:hypothetical protein
MSIQKKWGGQCNSQFIDVWVTAVVWGEAAESIIFHKSFQLRISVVASKNLCQLVTCQNVCTFVTRVKDVVWTDVSVNNFVTMLTVSYDFVQYLHSLLGDDYTTFIVSLFVNSAFNYIFVVERMDIVTFQSTHFFMNVNLVNDLFKRFVLVAIERYNLIDKPIIRFLIEKKRLIGLILVTDTCQGSTFSSDQHIRQHRCRYAWAH